MDAPPPVPRMRYVAGMSSGRLVSQLGEIGIAALALAIVLGTNAVAQSDAPGPAPTGQDTRVIWKYAPKGSSFNAVTVSKGTVFALDREGKVHAIDAKTGKVQWTSGDDIPMGYGFGLTVSPNQTFPALFVGCDKGFYALDRNSGKKLWHTAIDLGVAGPACTNAAVIAGAWDGKVYACALATGKILWEHEYLEDAPDDPPGLDGNNARLRGRPARPRTATTDGKMVLLSIFDQCRALALDVSTGKRLWSYNTKGWMYGTPSIGPNNVFLGSQDDHLYAIDKEMGKLMWKVKTGARVEGGATSTERFAYFGSCDSHLYAVDQTVGRVVWKYATEKDPMSGGPIYSRPVVIEDTVYLASFHGKVYAVNRKSGELLWKFQPLAKSEINSDLVLEGDRMFLTTRKDGKLGEGESAVVAIRWK